MIRDFFDVSDELLALDVQVLADCAPIFAAIDETRNYNQLKMLKAFTDCKVSATHLVGTTGYGYDDAGREKLGEVFARLVGAEDAYLRNTSSFYRMADEKQQFTQEVDFNRTYILGIVFRSVDGDPFLMYETEIQGNNTYSRSVKMLPISEEEVQALQVPETFGVWIG